MAVLLALVLPFDAACDSQDTARRAIASLRIGVLPDQPAEVLQKSYTPLFEYFAQELEISYEAIASNSYDELTEQFVAGGVDPGVANCHVIRPMFADGRLSRVDLRVIWETPPNPDCVWVVQPELDSIQKRAIRDAFGKLSPANDDHLRILRRMSAAAFPPTGIEVETGEGLGATVRPLLHPNENVKRVAT